MRTLAIGLLIILGFILFAYGFTWVSCSVTGKTFEQTLLRTTLGGVAATYALCITRRK